MLLKAEVDPVSLCATAVRIRVVLSAMDHWKGVSMSTADDRRSGQSQREQGPYVAETYVTAIDQRYVIVDIPE